MRESFCVETNGQIKLVKEVEGRNDVGDSDDIAWKTYRYL